MGVPRNTKFFPILRISDLSGKHSYFIAAAGLLVLLAVKFVGVGLAATSPLETANPDASPEAKQVLNYIADLSNQKDNKVISGQFIGYSGEVPSEYDLRVARLKKATDKWPGLIGADYAYWGVRPDHSKHNRALIDYWKSGGLVTISWHAKNPWNGKDSSDRTGSSDLKEVITPGTSAYTAWISQLDWAAEGLAQLRDAGVVVLWRPFHEMNGCWFWWGCQDKEGYMALWRHMFDYFTNTKGLNNLLWVYSPNGVDGSWIKPATFYYPGDAYVDIVGLDKYGDDIHINGYDEMLALGKPFGLTEFGPGGSCNNAPCPDGNFDYTKLITEIRNNYPKTSFFLAWGDNSVPWAIVDNQNAVKFLNDSWIINREEISWREPLFQVKQPEEITFPAYVEDEIIVKFKKGIAEEPIKKLNQKHKTTISRFSRFRRFRTLKIPEGRGVYEMAEIYARNPLVEYAEPNFFAFAALVPNDPYYSYQWHFENPDYGGIHMEPAWDITTGNPAVAVAVLDTGAAYENYEDPEDALCYDWLGRLKTCRPGINTYYQAPDLDNTNFLILPGSDFINSDDHPNDDEGHGTHVTGTVAQTTDNNLGVAGIAFNTTIMPVKVLDANGTGTANNIADGIYFAADNGAKIINLSLGSSSPSTTIENAVAYAYTQGVTVIAASGNAGASSVIYPAGYDSYVIAVGATRYDEVRSYYSNYGSGLDIVAPGGDVSVDQNEDGYGDGVLQQTFDADPSDFSYWFYQGTSMSTPHVSAVAALILALKPEFSPDQVRDTLQSTAEDRGAAGRDDQYGWGIVDAYAALSSLTPSVSISLITDGVVEFGILALGEVATSSSDFQKVLVETGPADLRVKSTVFADNGNAWALGTTNGPERVVWEFSPDASAWTIFEAADTLYSLASNVAEGAIQDIYFRLIMPTETASSNQHGATAAIVATVP